MNILLIGSGGREHALAWKLAQSPELGTLHAAPGNPGIFEHAQDAGLNPADKPSVVAYCREHDIGLVVVGPEVPLVDGLADALEAADILVFGPSAAAAQLEGSKGFTKDLCTRKRIPTARYGRFTDATAARDYVQRHGAPIVVKADGLAAGKGVTVAMTRDEALAAIDACFSGGDGDEVVVEEFLEGEEASLFCLCDGNQALAFGTAQDHKRAFDRDRGPNTGGMGAYSPALPMTPELTRRAMAEIVEPTLAGMREVGTPFKGVLYAGLMLTESGPKLIEYNVRFGDPEAQVLMLRLESDLLPILLACAKGDLSGVAPHWRDEVALTVVLAANGYPGTYAKGSEIRNLPPERLGMKVFQAGTRRDGERLLADGGRVLNVSATGATVRQAARAAYEAVAVIDWPDGFCRSDIGHRAIMAEPE
ncbi:phosphoribosylamine--glycine ligase [Mangrovicella endophytica]|uniref:phosphoribosylamine--glycine ligase n=1 Tax=Mangrovicella endophytica TaxID=2066697 RepID=UPI0018E4AD9B|nr:phosphoribosylamine--glycine ligase [Mangrovicella endophytica]